ncbi:MAG: bifunctional ornithine acetyltransferase/N-acetylglutamate synthase [Piscirickettsiaceae bacterium]|nr:MAG: bifunctional ornithine acetyltransferase/N-acetylglutamate synthase [Piscirickettsiaceae bacterium]
MPVGSDKPLALLPISGVRIGTAKAGIRQLERDDVSVFEISASATIAAVFTKNKFCAAPVYLAKKHLLEAPPRYLLVNSGNANAGLGAEGEVAAHRCCKALAELVGCHENQVLPFSTGVIGEPLAVDKLTVSLPLAIHNLSENNWQHAAVAIMTTDTRPKGCSRTLLIDGKPITITGIAKGSGMIRPNMATMLSYIATDMPIDSDVLNKALKKATDLSFNAITVDGDTSTNDAVVLIATGKAKLKRLDSKSDERYDVFLASLIEVFQHLSGAIVRDGEGATKVISINVEQARTVKDAREVAYTVAQSPLVKTAFFAADPNWGRILAAVGRADIEQMDIDNISIYLDDVCIVEQGKRSIKYTEEQGVEVMSADEITVRIVLAQGQSSASILTCDLSYDYVKINAEYRS